MAVISLNTTALPHFSQESTEGINTTETSLKTMEFLTIGGYLRKYPSIVNINWKTLLYMPELLKNRYFNLVDDE